MRALFARLHRVSVLDSPVLLQGETGTGKELAARAVHAASPRANGPFVVVDCAALPENLFEVELYGHTRGAFTGALHDRAGAIESGEGGTVFLDEIGELPLSQQPKLLRVLESASVRRIGEQGYRPVDARFLFATHRNLLEMVNEGTFREDLYFRVAVVPLTIPPLRERTLDIPLLLKSFFPHEYQGAITPSFVRAITARPWRGNVRELRNFVERAVALGTDEALALETPGAQRAPQAWGRPFKELRQELLDDLERNYLTELLRQHGRSLSAIAEAAGLDRSYVHRLIRKHGL